MVGASTNWNRPSYFAMKYMQAKGYRVIPVNPVSAGETILGEVVYKSLADIPLDQKVDMVDVFRNSNAAGAITDDAIAREGVRTVWMQLEVRNDEAAARAEAAGLRVVMDRCPKIEFARLNGEMGWNGFASGVISSKRRAPAGAGGGGGGEKQAGQAPGRSLDNSPPAPQFGGFETKLLHAGASPCPSTGARSTPIYQNTSYVFEDADHAASLFNLQTFGHIYSRLSNPTTAVLEERLATLEGGRGATCTASGHAAQVVALFALMQPGDRLVASTRLYGGSITQLGRTIQKFGWSCDFVDCDDLEAVQAALEYTTGGSANGSADGGAGETPPTKTPPKALWIESLANPGGVVSDITALADLAHAAGCPLIVDNTLASPYLCRPIEHGADLVVHSTTKFLSGHGNAMGGCVVDSGTFDWSADPTRFPSLSQPEPAYHGLKFHETFGDLAFTTFSHAVALRDLGPTMAPMNAYLTLLGVETLGLRMDRHCSNAQAVAEHLQAHPMVQWVQFAGLPDNRYHQLAKRYLREGSYGAVLTFGIKGGYASGVKLVESVSLLSHLANIGDTRSLVLHPASTTHRQLTDEQRAAAGAGDEVIRLSVGIESVADILADLDFGLAAAAEGGGL
jgi:O-acetylhomoserine (thiol)-lyase